MNESLMYGSVDQDGKRFPPLSSTINAWGENDLYLTGENLQDKLTDWAKNLRFFRAESVKATPIPIIATSVIPPGMRAVPNSLSLAADSMLLDKIGWSCGGNEINS